MALGPLFFVFVLTQLVLVKSAEEEKHSPICKPFVCAKLGVIHYPCNNMQPGYCGLYALDCSEQKHPKIQLKEGGHWYHVSCISFPNNISINDHELKKILESSNCESLEKFGLPSPSPYSKLYTPRIVNLFKCNSSLHITTPHDFHSTRCGDYNLYYSGPLNSSFDTNTHNNSFPPQQCSNIQLPASNGRANVDKLFESLLTSSFYLEMVLAPACMECSRRRRQCLLDSKNQLRCSKGNLYITIYEGTDFYV